MVCEQGPCHKGDLVVVNPLTTEAYCSCDPDLLSQYFYPPLKLCYEHFTKVHKPSHKLNFSEKDSDTTYIT